jgi:ankyrin repeat protein
MKKLLFVIGILFIPYVTYAMQGKGFPLHMAALIGHVSEVRNLLNDHPDWINKPYISPANSDQRLASSTPLHCAMGCMREEVVSLLLEKGANPNLQDTQGLTPLHYAVRLKKANFARLLLDRGANEALLDPATTKEMHELLYPSTWLRRIWNMVPSKKVIASTTVLALAGYAAWRIWRR